jgi:hypothetical protein
VHGLVVRRRVVGKLPGRLGTLVQAVPLVVEARTEELLRRARGGLAPRRVRDQSIEIREQCPVAVGVQGRRHGRLRPPPSVVELPVDPERDPVDVGRLELLDHQPVQPLPHHLRVPGVAEAERKPPQISPQRLGHVPDQHRAERREC